MTANEVDGSYYHLNMDLPYYGYQQEPWSALTPEDLILFKEDMKNIMEAKANEPIEAIAKRHGIDARTQPLFLDDIPLPF